MGYVLSPLCVNGPKRRSPGSTTAVHPVFVDANVTCSQPGTVTWCPSAIPAVAVSRKATSDRLAVRLSRRFKGTLPMDAVAAESAEDDDGLAATAGANARDGGLGEPTRCQPGRCDVAPSRRTCV